MKKIFLLSVLTVFTAVLSSADPYNYLAGKISKGAKQLANKKIAILPFQYYDGRESPGCTIVSEHLTTSIVEQKEMQVVERALLDKVIMEMKLGKTGELDQQTTKELGKILGVDAVVTGTLIEDVGSDEVDINARLIKVETGEILVAASKKIKKTWLDSRPVISKPVSQSEQQQIRQPAPAPAENMPEQSAMGLDLGENSLQENKYDEAILIAENVLKKYPDNPAIDSRAWFVIGRVREAKGEPRKARLVYLKIIRDYPQNVFVVKAAKERLKILGGGARRR